MIPEDERDRDERPKRSWREIDQMRDGTGRASRDERRPRGAKAQARAQSATKEYLRQLDKQLFSEDKGGAEGADLAKAVREAHGTPQLGDACRAYAETLGMPNDVSLLSMFLDTADPELVVPALEAMLAAHQAGSEISRGVRSQLRMLEQDSNDDVAYAAEELLGQLD